MLKRYHISTLADLNIDHTNKWYIIYSYVPFYVSIVLNSPSRAYSYSILTHFTISNFLKNKNKEEYP